MSNATPYQIFTQWLVTYDVTADEVAQFAKQPLVATKVNIGERFYQLELASADTRVFRESAATLASAAPTP